MSAPLATLKILDFSTLLPGPYATMMLADLGADVLRIEAPGRPDLVRLTPPFDKDGISAHHAVLGRSKSSLGLNLKADGALDIVHKLILDGGYNIIVEQFRPGVMDRLGVGYEALKAICPDLIYCSLTGYGQTGPYRDRAGHDINYLALSGILSYHGRAEQGPPAPLPIQVADVGAGSLNLVIGLLSAVIRRMTTGEGGHVDISMYDGSLAWNNLAAASTFLSEDSPAREKMTLNGGGYYDIYETADGEFLSVGSLEPKFWTGFCRATGLDHLIETGLNLDVSLQHPHKPEVEARLREKTLAEWMAIFEPLDICVEPILTTAEALDHPHAAARGMVVDVPGPDGSTQPQIASPIKITDHEPEYRFKGSIPGANTRATLEAVGYSGDEIAALYDQGVVA